MSMALNSWKGFRFYQHPGTASTMLPFVFALADKKLCSWVMSCIIRCKCTVQISAPYTANFQKSVEPRVNGSFPMRLRIKRSASLLISQKVPPATSSGETKGSNGNSFNPRLRTSEIVLVLVLEISLADLYNRVAEPKSCTLNRPFIHLGKKQISRTRLRCPIFARP